MRVPEGCSVTISSVERYRRMQHPLKSRRMLQYSAMQTVEMYEAKAGRGNIGKQGVMQERAEEVLSGRYWVETTGKRLVA